MSYSISTGKEKDKIWTIANKYSQTLINKALVQLQGCSEYEIVDLSIHVNGIALDEIKKENKDSSFKICEAFLVATQRILEFENLDEKEEIYKELLVILHEFKSNETI